jgi:recombination protein RecT
MNEMTAITKVMQRPETIERFVQVLGNEASAKNYVWSVIMAVNGNDDLMNCAQDTIIASAIRSATLRLSVDPAIHQAYLVPYGKKCTLIVGYKGLYDMAIRTGHYTYLNPGVKIYEGQEPTQHPLTGYWTLEGFKESNTVIGWLAAFKMSQKFNGIEQAVYMTLEDIEHHKETYAKGWQKKDSAWQKAPEAMQRKTVLRKLLNEFGYFDPFDHGVLQQMREDNFQPIEIGEVVDPSMSPDEPPPSAEDEIKSLGFEIGESKGRVVATRSRLDQEAKKLGVIDKDLIDKIVAECDNNFGEALTIIETQHAPPQESEG